MTKYQNVILFGNAKWHEVISGNSAQQLANALLKLGYKVIYISPNKAKVKKTSNFVYIDVHNSLDNLDSSLKNWNANHANSLFISSLANKKAGDLLSYFKEKSFKIIYRHVDFFDDIEEESGYSISVAHCYCKEANLVSISHPALDDNLPAKPINLITQANGIDQELYRLRTGSKTPHDLLTGEITLGFWGTFWGNRLDWDFLKKLAEEEETWSFNFIGKQEYLDIGNEQRRSNMNFIDEKTPEDLCIYRNHFDVCLIPYKTTHSFARYSNPIKTLEYLAGYKPVLSNHNSSIENYPFVYFYSDVKEARKLIPQINNIKVDKDKVNQFLDKNTWEERVKELLTLVK